MRCMFTVIKCQYKICQKHTNTEKSVEKLPTMQVWQGSWLKNIRYKEADLPVDINTVPIGSESLNVIKTRIAFHKRDTAMLFTH